MKDYQILAVIFRITVDYLLILAANRCAGYLTGPLRPLLAVAFGGLHAAGCMMPKLWFLNSSLCRGSALILMCLIAFYGQSFFLRSTLFTLLRLSMDGLTANRGTMMDIFWAGILCAVVIFGFRDRIGFHRIIPVELCYNGKTLKLDAFRDTGNTLRDPVTGRSVMVVDAKIANALTGLSEKELMSPVETIEKNPGFRLIPYRTVGQPAGMLLGLFVKKSRIGGTKGSALVALSPQILDESGKFQALIGEVI